MNPHINQLLTPKINQEEIHQPVNPQNLIETPVQNINSDIPKDFQNSQNPYNESIFSDASSSKSKSPSIVRSSSHSDNGRDSRTPSKKSRSPSRSRSRSRSPSNKSYRSRDFIMKNGCCKECMRAFSKTGKSCLCQVPKNERKYILPEKGCNYCGCHGCNPVDVRRDKRSDLKKQLKNDKNIQYKNQRLLESEDEELKINVK